MPTINNNRAKNLGFLLVLVLVFGAVFFTIISSFFGYISTQSRVVHQKVVLQQSLDIAEAGMNYYKWYLAHYPNDLTDGTGLPGPYVHQYFDPEGGAIGEFSINVASTTYCGEVSTIEVTSVGHTYEEPAIKRTITARYSRPNVAEYAYIINSSVWAGADRVIVGPYHSNGGIRMDGTNNSTVTSGQSTWTCTSTFGCSPNSVRAGVFTSTANANTALFSFPSAPIDFNGLAIDLSQMQTKATTGGGISLPASGAAGYRVVFNNNNTITVSRVTGTTAYYGLTTEYGWQTENHVISATTPYGTYAINPSCPLIYVQDKVWLEGTVAQKVTIAAANMTSTTINPQIILNNNITYTSTSSGLLAIAEQDVLIGLVVPDNMSLNGIFVAKNGRFGRNRYCENNLAGDGCNNTYRLPSAPVNLRPYGKRNSLTVNGTIVSLGREGTRWTYGGDYVSGFNTRSNTYDRNLVLNPPPLVPKTSDVYVITDWKDNR